jgi:arabinofuranan 3-O-arabinosyltransferase
MWDPNIGMGTVTHQTIGYAFPMGPYYWVLDKIGFPDWVAQRLWLGSLLFFAGVGVLYLLRTFGARGPGVVVAALAYMFTPYVLDYSSRISVLLMPWAALPWMIAVVRKALQEDRRGLAAWRYPAIFALIVQVIGGVNATALLFAGIGPVLWIVYAWLIAREITFRRALAVTVRIGVLTLLTSLWWISGLRMQAAYGLDILRYTETVDAVARTSTPNEVLRGLGYWFFYGQDRLGPWTEASIDYTQRVWVILAGYTLAAIGLASAAFLRWRHRAFFVVMLVIGVIIAVGAHPYNSPTPLGALFKALSAGSTAALAMRSTGRVVPIVVLSLAIFTAFGVNTMVKWLRNRGHNGWAIAVPAIIVVLLAVNFPALHNGTYYGKNLVRAEEIPDYWKQAIASLGSDKQTRVIEVPGADFASYRWGNTVDPITPGLTDRPYVARELIPYGTAGTADLLNALDRRLQEGDEDPQALVPLFRRMGIGTVLARNDIQYERYDLVPPRELRRVLAQAKGLSSPALYGPATSYLAAVGYEDERTLSAPPNEPHVAPIAIYQVKDPSTILRTESNSGALMLSGDGEGLVDAAGAGLLDNAGVIRYSASYNTPEKLRAAVAEGGSPSVLVVTDGNRLRARKWSSVKDNVGYTEEPGEADKPLDKDNGDARLPVFLNAQPNSYTTTDEVGIKRITASSYGNTITYTPEDRPAMAMDGDVNTAWRAAAFGPAVGQRIHVDFDGPVTTDQVQLTQVQNRGRNRWITQVQLTFDGKDRYVANLDDSSRALFGEAVHFPRRTFSSLEIKVTKDNQGRTNLYGGSDSVGFAEIGVKPDGAAAPIHLTELETMPSDLLDALGPSSAQHPLVLVLRRDAIRPVPPRVQPELAINREFTLPTARTFVLTGNGAVSTDASPKNIDAAYGLLDAQHGGVTVESSPILPGCLHCRADQAIDGDPLTAWETPITDVVGQNATFTSPTPLSFDHMDLRVLADGRHSLPTKLHMEVDGEARDLTIPPLASNTSENASDVVRLSFPRVSGRKIFLRIDAIDALRATTFSTGPAVMPVGIAELGIDGLTLPKAPARIDSGCVSNLVHIDLKPVPVRVTGASADGDQVMGLTVTPCDPKRPGVVPKLKLAAGRHVLTTARRPDAGFSIDRLVLASGAGNSVGIDNGRVTQIGDASTAPKLDVISNGRTSARVHITGATQPFWMVLGQSHSPGWHARVVGGRDLGAPQLVDGYANGWLVAPKNAEAFDIAIDWTPQKQVWASIWISLVAALLCLVLIGLTWRRRVTAAEVAAADGGAEVATIEFWPEGEALTPTVGRARWLAPVLAGLLAGIAVAPWVGILVAVLTALIAWRRDLRPYVLLAPPVALLACGVYMSVEQKRLNFPPVFEWPTLFPRARTFAWIAVMIIAADMIVELLRERSRLRSASPHEPASTTRPTGESSTQVDVAADE